MKYLMLMDLINAILHHTQFQNSVASGVVLLIITSLAKVFSPRSRVIWGVSHEFHFTLPARDGVSGQPPTPPLSVRTRAIFVHNVGNAEAENVEIYLGMEPQHFQLWPLNNYETARTPEGHFVLKVPSLTRKEHLIVEVLQIGADLPVVARIRSKSGEAAFVQMIPQRIYAWWVTMGAGTLALIGAFVVIKLILDFLRSAGTH